MHQTTCGRYLRRFAKYQDQLKDIVRYTDPKTNIIVKTAIGKKWAQTDKLDFDYDASLFASCVYWLAMFQDRSATLVPLKNGNEYTITCDRICYRGDTMNSWVTTVGIYFGVGNKWRKFLDNTYFDKKYLPEYITEFMNAVYTLGNFFPLPRALNTPRSSSAKDYWDLALLAIYQYYKNTEDEAYEPEFKKCTWEWVFGTRNEETCIKWLGSFNGWHHFVEQNFLQDFVHEDKENGGYGRPKELWKGHFDGEVLPMESDEFSEFFTNASAWILARGARIALEVKNQLEDKDLYDLARRMVG